MSDNSERRRLSKAEADAVIQALTDTAAASERALRRAATHSGTNLLGPINAVNNAFASAMNAVRATEIRDTEAGA